MSSAVSPPPQAANKDRLLITGGATPAKAGLAPLVFVRKAWTAGQSPGYLPPGQSLRVVGVGMVVIMLLRVDKVALAAITFQVYSLLLLLTSLAVSKKGVMFLSEGYKMLAFIINIY